MSYLAKVPGRPSRATLFIKIQPFESHAEDGLGADAQHVDEGRPQQRRTRGLELADRPARAGAARRPRFGSLLARAPPSLPRPGRWSARLISIFVVGPSPW